MDAPDPAPARPIRRSWLHSAARGCVLGLVLALLVEAVRVLAGDNVHTVLPGRVYRSAQLDPATLERVLRGRHIRTVINLRGCCNPFPWYLDECRVTHRLGVAQEDICFSAGRLPSVHEIRRLVDVLDHTAYPVLFHCQRGADRTGLASTVAQLLQTDTSFATARRQLGLRYGHLALGRPAKLDLFFDLYAEYLRDHGLVHSRAVFRRWLVRDYCPGACSARLELLEAPARIPANQPVALRVRAHNISAEPWHLRPGPTAGIHGVFTVYDDKARCYGNARAALFRADVPPGGSIDFTLALPSLSRGHYRLLADLVDEQHCHFFQTGSEPLEQELEVCEEETSPDGQPAAAGPAGLDDRLAPRR
jgi:protein tyrosine phosphatase (PTP) superfamily phosphohydrolase (DUF442 family)